MSDNDPGDASPSRQPQPGLYRHYKGGLYTVICVGRHSETEEWLVTYRAEASGTFWVRPLALWNEDVLLNDVPRPRFVPAGQFAGTTQSDQATTSIAE